MGVRPIARRVAPGVVLGAFAALGVAAPLAAQARVRIIQRDSAKADSTAMKITIDMGEIMRMTSELMTSKAMEERIGMALRGANDPARERELSSQLEEIAKRRAGLITRLQLQCSRTDDMPDGYLGLTYELPSRVVSSVEPGSPAAKAGLRRGDEVVMINSYEAQDAPLAMLLKPGAKVTLKLRRDGAQKELPIVVGRRPDGFGATACTGIDDLTDGPPVVAFFKRPRGTFITPEAPSAPTAPPPPNFVFSYSTTPGMSAVAGASLTPVDDDWRETLGVEKGLVVISVASGSPAAESGLRKGDVIVQADDAPVVAVRSLQRALNDSDSRTVKLQVIRRGKPQLLTLRWR
ncbi:MAG: PDZ domain-containing protein [Gemmatimonadetes bacterium]|nr:PDZ domain-containing protein [Gemmatimonadota bacterium]MBI3569238.1 PDZ domain-containing protein [Gemmatimonadota bacterium]